MDIRINKITLHNFKGIRDLSLTFGGKNARIDGENGAGKSTVFDAFTWLLFGKDHRGLDWTNFDLKPIDPDTGEAIHNLDYWVEGELTIDGTKRTLRRQVTEDWVKPRGESQKVLKGHKQTFFIDGVDTATKKAYDAAVSQWIDEGVFKMITNPHYFIDDQYTDWKARRKAILELAGPAPTLDEFEDLIAEMRGEPLEQFRKRIAAEKKANKEELAKAEANIRAWKAALPDVSTDTKAIDIRIQQVYKERDRELDQINAQIRTIDKGLADINAANSGRQDQINALNREITKIRLEQDSLIKAGIEAAMQESRQASAKTAEARLRLGQLNTEARTLEQSIKVQENEIKTYQEDRDETARSLRELGDEYQKEKERLFEYEATEVCPTCGQPLPPERIQEAAEEARRKFLENQKKALGLIVNKANQYKAFISNFDEAIAERKEKLQEEYLMLSATKKEIEALLQAPASEPVAAPDPDAIEAQVRKTPEFIALAKKDLDLQAEIMKLGGENISVDALLNDRRRLEADITRTRDSYERQARPLLDQVALAAERQRMEDMIAKEEVRQKTFADAVADLERLEFRTTEYAKAEVDAQEGAINALFKVARWKMFSPTLDGGLTEMCEVTTAAGVPYRSMNDAAKILCGLDVIRVFSERHDVTAPIFIDNAESITRKAFDTKAQVIRLCVKEDSELTMTQE